MAVGVVVAVVLRVGVVVSDSRCISGNGSGSGIRGKWWW